MPHTPHTPHTPGGNGPPSVPPTPQQDTQTSNNVSTDEIPSDLNFDPAAVIDGEGQDQENLILLPDNVVDPMELLSYLDPPDLATPPGSGSSKSNNGPGGPSTNDDILALFE